MNFLLKILKGFFSALRKPFWIVSLWLRRRYSIALTAKLKGIDNILLATGSSVGHGAVLDTTKGGKIVVGKNSGFGPYTYVNTWGGDIILGDHTTVDSFGVIYGHGGLRIGDNVLIATQVAIIPANHGFDDPKIPIRQQAITCKGITIQDDVWIGAGAKILDGVTIEKGSVIGAGSVVTHDIPPYSVAVGVPAKVIRKRRME